MYYNDIKYNTFKNNCTNNKIKQMKMFLISTNRTLKRKTKMNHFVHFKIRPVNNTTQKDGSPM